MKLSKRNNKKKEKRTRRKQKAGNIYYASTANAASFFYTNHNKGQSGSKIKRIEDYKDRLLNPDAVGHNNTYGMILGDLIVIRYISAGLLGTKLSIVVGGGHNKEIFSFKTLEFNQIGTSVSSRVGKFYNMFAKPVAEATGLDVGSCTINNLHKCYGKDFKFGANQTHNSKSSIWRGEADQIFILKEGIVGGKSHPMDSVIDNYTENIYSFIVFLKLLNSSISASNYDTLRINPTWVSAILHLMVKNGYKYEKTPFSINNVVESIKDKAVKWKTEVDRIDIENNNNISFTDTMGYVHKVPIDYINTFIQHIVQAVNEPNEESRMYRIIKKLKEPASKTHVQSTPLAQPPNANEEESDEEEDEPDHNPSLPPTNASTNATAATNASRPLTPLPSSDKPWMHDAVWIYKTSSNGNPSEIQSSDDMIHGIDTWDSSHKSMLQIKKQDWSKFYSLREVFGAAEPFTVDPSVIKEPESSTLPVAPPSSSNNVDTSEHDETNKLLKTLSERLKELGTTLKSSAPTKGVKAKESSIESLVRKLIGEIKEGKEDHQDAVETSIGDVTVKEGATEIIIKIPKSSKKGGNNKTKRRRR